MPKWQHRPSEPKAEFGPCAFSSVVSGDSLKPLHLILFHKRGVPKWQHGPRVPKAEFGPSAFSRVMSGDSLKPLLTNVVCQTHSAEPPLHIMRFRSSRCLCASVLCPPCSLAPFNVVRCVNSTLSGFCGPLLSSGLRLWALTAPWHVTMAPWYWHK